MKIKKKEPSVGIVGKVLNLFSDSSKDTYSCDYINKIVEMGTNSSGNYIKYANGVIMCYGVTSNISFSSSGVKDGSISVSSFGLKSIQTVQLTLMVNYADYGNGKFQTHVRTSDINNITYSIRNEYTSTINFYINWFAIGRWK